LISSHKVLWLYLLILCLAMSNAVILINSAVTPINGVLSLH